MPNARKPVRNNRLLIPRTDPMGLDKSIVRFEKRIFAALEEATKLMLELDNNYGGPNELIAKQAQDVDTEEVKDQMEQLTQRLGRAMTDIMRQCVSIAYRSGRGYAQRQLQRMQRLGGPPSARLSKMDRELIRLLRNMNLQHITTISRRHIAEAGAIIAQGRIDGLSHDEIVLEMMRRLHTSEVQARRIVRTEIIRAANIAARRQYLESGLRYWQWQVTRTRSTGLTSTKADERVCEVCKPLHGKIVIIGEALNPFLSAAGRKKLKHAMLTHPPAHPNCRCIMAPAYPPTKAKRVKPTGRPVKVMHPKLTGFSRWDKQELQKILKHIPNDVKRLVKTLRGHWEIKKTSGRLVDNPEVQQFLSPALQHRYRNATGLYIGGIHNRIFVSSSAGKDEVIHEIGHAIYDEYFSNANRMRTRTQFDQIHEMHLQTGDFITARAAISPREHFADAVRFYLLKPAVLRLQFPEIYDFLRREVFFGNERDSIVTLEDNHFKINVRGRWKEYCL